MNCSSSDYWLSFYILISTMLMSIFQYLSPFAPTAMSPEVYCICNFHMTVPIVNTYQFQGYSMQCFLKYSSSLYRRNMIIYYELMERRKIFIHISYVLRWSFHRNTFPWNKINTCYCILNKTTNLSLLFRSMCSSNHVYDGGHECIFILRLVIEVVGEPSSHS